MTDHKFHNFLSIFMNSIFKFHLLSLCLNPALHNPLTPSCRNCLMAATKGGSPAGLAPAVAVGAVVAGLAPGRAPGAAVGGLGGAPNKLAKGLKGGGPGRGPELDVPVDAVDVLFWAPLGPVMIIGVYIYEQLIRSMSQGH